MSSIQQHLEDISEIRNIVEEATKFPSLSGLSGVMVGLLAITGSALAVLREPELLNDFRLTISTANPELLLFLVGDALAVLVLAWTSAVVLSVRMARKKELPVWNRTARAVVVNLAIPLCVGGLFCLVLVFHHLAWLVPSAMLLFYGMALLSAGKFTLKEVQVLGVTQMGLGILCALLPAYALAIWSFGFGILHILYGIFLYRRYER